MSIQITEEISSFSQDDSLSSKYSKEYTADLYAILFMQFLIIMLFIFIKNYRLAWLLATVLTPIAGIIFLAFYFNIMALYYFYALPFFIIAAGIVSAITGFIIYLCRRYRR